MSAWLNHLVVAPIALPLITGAAMLMLDEKRRTLRSAMNIVSTITLTGVTIGLMYIVSDTSPATLPVYRLGSWPAPFGIVLVLDRLSALMLVLTSILACASLLFSIARWHRAGLYFHPLFQFLLMGLNGAFLTGDLFNLFVFFELLLAASYGLVLHGSGFLRVRAGLQYIAVNLAAAFLFLLGVSLIYAVTGTLNMADLAVRIPAVAPENRMLLEAGAALLGIAFLVKAGMWPLCFWLTTTYAAASPPAAAIFAVMTKVGVYIVLRLSLLLFSDAAGSLANFGGPWLLFGGMMTIVFGTIGILASQDMARLAGSTVLVSSGTLLAAIGTGQIAVASSALFYLISSTIALCAFFLLIELVERGREPGADVFAVTMEAFGEDDDTATQEEEIGIATPAAIAVLSLSFICCALLLAGLPPLSGFIAKFALLTAILNPSELGASGAISPASWMLLFLIIASGLATIIAMTRAGIRAFWLPLERSVPSVQLAEIVPIAMLLLLCGVMTVQAGPVMRYMQSTTQSLRAPQDYIGSVLSPAVPRSAGKEGT